MKLCDRIENVCQTMYLGGYWSEIPISQKIKVKITFEVETEVEKRQQWNQVRDQLQEMAQY